MKGLALENGVFRYLELRMKSKSYSTFPNLKNFVSNFWPFSSSSYIFSHFSQLKSVFDQKNLLLCQNFPLSACSQFRLHSPSDPTNRPSVTFRGSNIMRINFLKSFAHPLINKRMPHVHPLNEFIFALANSCVRVTGDFCSHCRILLRMRYLITFI